MTLSPNYARQAAVDAARSRNVLSARDHHSTKKSSGPCSDVVFRNTGLTVGEVSGTKRNKVFGFDPYINPKADHRYRIPGTAECKLKRENFADRAAKDKSWVPSPNQFKQPSWKIGPPGTISNIEPEKHTI